MFNLRYFLIALVYCRMTVCLNIYNKNVKVVDLTHTFDNKTLYWGLKSHFKFTILHRGNSGEWWYESNKFEAEEHGGTHIDTPAHFAEGHLRVHEIELSNLLGPGIRIDVSEKAAKNPDYLVSVDDFKEWERVHSEIPKQSIILLDTGWSKFWPRATKVFGTGTPENTSTYHFPGLDPDAASWIVAERPTVKAIGIDTPSMDFGQSKQFVSHRILASKNISGLENVANLHELPALDFTIFAIPMEIRDGSGSPTRIFALLADTSSASKIHPMLQPLLCLLFYIF